MSDDYDSAAGQLAEAAPDPDGPVICPRCKTTIEGPVVTRSRVDNATRICGSCGTKEALWNFEHPEGDLPDLSNPIPA